MMDAPTNRGWRVPQLSLENVLILVMVIVGLISLIMMAGVSYWRSRSVLEASIQNEVESVANLTEGLVERWLNTRETDAKTYSSIILSERGQIPVMQDILESTGQTYEAIYFTNANGIVQFGLRQTETEGEISYDDGYREGHNFRNDGTSFFTDLESASRTDVIEYAPFESVKTMFFYHEVLDGGAVRGYIFLQVSPTELRGLSERFSDGDGISYIQIGNEYVVSNASIDPLDENIELVKKAADALQGVNTLQGFSDTNVVGAWRGNSNLGYIVYAQIPQSKALSPIIGLGFILIGVAVVGALLVGVLAYFASRYVTRPIRDLTKAMREFTRGSMDTPIAHLLERKDVIGEQARAFHELTDTLRVQVYEATENRQYLEEVLTSYMKFVERVSRGDLTSRLSLNGQTGNNLIVANVRVEQDDNLLRLGYNLNRMVEALHSMASQTRDVARSLSEAAVQILESSTQQISAATQQDAAVSQTTSTVQEVRATVAETAERAQMVAEAAQQSVEISRQGQHAVAETIEGMNVIRSRVESIAENILMLSERTTQIGDIIATVNAIADQSKMLALNASIEAARAGEEGRGFAVVAMEVRNLAEQSREATAQVRDILSEIQQATNTAVMVTEEGTKGVDLGVQLVDRAGRAIRELAGKLEEASQAAMQIAASTRQQSQGMDQLTSSMTSIKATSSTTATIMQASQRNAKDLNEMARQMEAAISAYKL